MLLAPELADFKKSVSLKANKRCPPLNRRKRNEQHVCSFVLPPRPPPPRSSSAVDPLLAGRLKRCPGLVRRGSLYAQPAVASLWNGGEHLYLAAFLSREYHPHFGQSHASPHGTVPHYRAFLILNHIAPNASHRYRENQKCPQAFPNAH